MDIRITKTPLEAVQDFRVLFLHENRIQFVHDKCHRYGWADTWIIHLDGAAVGYGSVWGTNKREDRDTLFEFYLLPPFRRHASLVFRGLLAATGVTLIDCQTNDPLLTNMLHESAREIRVESILFQDHVTTHLPLGGAVFHRETDTDEGANALGYVLSVGAEVVAGGGFMLNYNMPYADIYMEVKEPFRNKGFGSLIVQELKKEIYQRRRVPAARCNPHNHASKATLQKAGFAVCGAWLQGSIDPSGS